MNFRPLLLAVVLVPAAGCSFEIITGSGNPTTETYDVKDFTSVEANSAFEVEIARGNKFDVAVTADDNLIEFVRVEVEDGTLSIGIEGGKHVQPKSEMKVAITMPALESVRLNGACTGTIAGFKHTKDFKAEANGASTLKGDIDAVSINIQANGASTVKLKGIAGEADLQGSGASTVALGDLTLESASVTLSGASSATVNVTGELDYSVSGASHLHYRGEPKIGKHEASGASSAGPK